MPTYLYMCPVCGSEQRLLRAIKDRDNDVECRNRHDDGRAYMQRQLEAPAVSMGEHKAVPRG